MNRKNDVPPAHRNPAERKSVERNPTTKELQESYDRVPYPNHAKPFTHISRLAAIGRLRGLDPASPDQCTVLELGCADGGNLLPMAVRFPHSRFVGIDLSPVQIDMGHEQASQLAVSNLDLRTQDILEIKPGDLESFDYIIIHGVFSWVPVEVQDKLLKICGEHLSENGLAYISYNSFPGWHGKQALRKMLRYHTRGFNDLQQKAQAALEFIAAFPSLDDYPDEPGSILVHQLRHNLANIDDPLTYLVHEYLIDTNEPLYFHDFLDRIEAVGLSYVDDAYPGSTALERLPPASGKWINENFAKDVEQQQYVDFFCNISFRRSLISRHPASRNQDLDFEPMKSLFATATCRQHQDDDNGVRRFVNDPGRMFSIGHTGLQQALAVLVQARPASVSVAELRTYLGNEISDEDAGAMFGSLLRNAAIEFTTHPFDCRIEVSERPFASRLVRHQASSGTVTSANHRPVGLANLLEQHLVQLLDGTRTLHELVAILSSQLKPDPPKTDAEWDDIVRSHLSRLAQAGILSDPDRL